MNFLKRAQELEHEIQNLDKRKQAFYIMSQLVDNEENPDEVLLDLYRLNNDLSCDEKTEE